MASVGSLITYLVQDKAGAVAPITGLLPGLRIENILVSYVTYIGKTLWPTGLACWYPYPKLIPLWEAALCGAGLVAVTVCSLRLARRGRALWLAIGWLWFLITLLPVIGIVQVGSQSRADRYMYIPMTGLLIMVVWGASDVSVRWPRSKAWLAAGGAAICLGMLPVTWAQIQTWRNTEILFTRDLQETNENYTAYNILATQRMGEGRLTEAILYLKEAIRINPDYPEANNNLGAVLGKLDRWPEAVPYFRVASGVSLRMTEAHRNLGEALIKTGKASAAVDALELAVAQDPTDADSQNMLGFALAQRPRRLQDAIYHIREALALNPELQTAHANLGALLAASPDDRDEALAELRTALSMKPDDQASADSLRKLEANAGR
jgi:Flp pilus assembly protein TadD